MTKMSILGKDNPFYKARIASPKESFKSRCDTAKDIFISRRRLEEIETGKREPYADELLIMAEAYDAPYLIEHYCNHICKIGQKFGCKYVENKGDAYKATVQKSGVKKRGDNVWQRCQSSEKTILFIKQG